MTLRVVSVGEDDSLVEFVLRLAYRLFPEYEARWVEWGLYWSQEWADTLVLLEDGAPRGFIQVYVWPCCDTLAGIHHYIAVEPSRWGRGYGKVLLASGEELLSQMGAEIYLATIDVWNKRSASLFRSMCYTLLTLEDYEALREYRDCLDEMVYVVEGPIDARSILEKAYLAIRDAVRTPPRSLKRLLTDLCQRL